MHWTTPVVHELSAIKGSLQAWFTLRYKGYNSWKLIRISSHDTPLLPPPPSKNCSIRPNRCRIMKNLNIQVMYITWHRASAESGVSSAGLMTTVHPAAMAGAAFLHSIDAGKFHWRQNDIYWDFETSFRSNSHRSVIMGIANVEVNHLLLYYESTSLSASNIRNESLCTDFTIDYDCAPFLHQRNFIIHSFR